MENIFYYNSPFGIFKGVLEDDTLISFQLSSDTNCAKNPAPSKIKNELDEYFLGKRKSFDIKISPKGSDFQKRVWKELGKIPCGKTKTYSEIAKNIGKEKAYRAVGTACGKNPILIIIPCHRVCAQNGLGGYALGLDKKKFLLELEK